jgi:hypothetical protein
MARQRRLGRVTARVSAKAKGAGRAHKPRILNFGARKGEDNNNRGFRGNLTQWFGLAFEERFLNIYTSWSDISRQNQHGSTGMETSEDLSEPVAQTTKDLSDRVAAAASAGAIVISIFFIELVIKGFG